MLSDEELNKLKSQMTTNKLDLSNAKDKVIKGENVFSRIGADIKKRVENVKESFGRTMQKEQSPIEGGLQLGGQIAGGIGDIVGNVAISALNKIIPSFIKKDAKEAAEGILQTKFGKDALNAFSGGIQKYEDWKKTNPRAAANFESVINVADLASDLFGIGAVKSVAKETLEEGTEQLLKKGVKKLGKEVGEEAIQETGEKVAKETVEEIPEKVAKRSLAGEIATTATSQVTGLDPKTIRNIITDPDLLKKAKVANREEITKNVEKAFKQKVDEVAELGKSYNPIRESKVTIDIPENTMENVLSGKYGLTFGKDGKIILGGESAPLSPSDIKALEDFMSQYGKAKTLSPNAFLNARTKLNDVGSVKWGDGKTTTIEKIVTDLRNTLNDTGRPQIPGLEELDNKFAPQAEYLKDLRKQITTNGEVSIQKIANLDGKNRAKALEVVRGSIPDIDEQLKIVKAIEDIELAKGQKVGAYTRGAISGGAVGLATGNPLLGIATAILSYPSVAIPMIEQFGKVRNLSKSVVNNLIKQLKSGKIEKASEQLMIDMLNWAESGLRKEGIREVTAQ